MRPIRLIIWISCFLLVVDNFAQTIVEPQSLTINDGLSQGYVSALHQDREGFMWIGTKNGLNRYDGEAFEVFTHDTTDPYSISNDWISTIHEEGDFLLVGTYGATLNLFHKRSKRFYKIPIKSDQTEPFVFIKAIKKGSANKFWIITIAKNQLIEVTFPEQFWKELHNNESILEQVTQKVVVGAVDQISTNYDGNIFIKKGTKLSKLNENNHKLEPFDLGSTDQQFNNVKIISPSISFQLSDEGSMVQRINLQINGKWEVLETDLKFSPFYFYEKDADRIWLQDKDSYELLIFDAATIASKTKLNKSDALFTVKNLKAGGISWIKDRSGIIWVGTGGFGVKKISPRKLKVQTYQSGKSVYNRLFSSSPGEIFYHHPRSISYYKQGENDILKSVHQLAQTRIIDRLYWLKDGPQSGWLAVIEKITETEEKYALTLFQYEEKQLKEIIKFNLDTYWNESKLSILKSSDSKLLLTHSNFIIQYDPLTKQHKTFQFNLFEDIPPFIFYTAQTANGNIWIGTSEGLVRAKPTENNLTFDLVKKGLRSSVCASLLVDPENPDILWIGTKGGGLHRLNTQTMKFDYLNTKNGLPNDVIYAVLNDDEGNIWMSSNKGIIRYTPNTGIIRNFTEEDGMQSNEFNTYTYGKTPNGALMFGGINGLNVFHPKDLKDNPHAPAVRITGLDINNARVDIRDSSAILNESVEYTQSITLPFSKNSVNLTFSALEFTAPGKNQFKYYLEGAEQEWAHQSTENKAQYLNLSPGSYTFKISAANGDGVWSNQIRTLDIIIQPPWYRSNLAYLIYLALIGLGFWQFLKFQKRRFQLRHQVEMEQREAERLKELDLAKSKLYTNITHEFRTPLTVISGMAESMKGDDDAKNLIKRNSDQLLNLVNQMLDLRKLESGQITIQKIQGDIVRHLRYLTESLKSFAELQELNLHFLSDEPKLIMDFDPEKITRIYSNLLSNAIKFTPEGGDIYVQLLKGSEQEFILKVKDTGIGIPKEQLAHIFNRFYQVDDSSTRRGEGTGIGLTLVYELIKAMGGEINVNSVKGEGTTFTIQLPITKLAKIEQENKVLPGADASMLSNLSSATHLKDTTATVSDNEDEKPTALLIEDNADVIHYLISCLKDYYAIEIAMNGAEGIEKAIEHIPDLIVSDVMMPEKDGFEVCQTLKTDERTSHIPIVLLTAKADFESRLEGLQRGADAYLQKPFHKDELLIILRSQLELRKKLQTRFAHLEPLTQDAETTNTSVAPPELQLEKEDAFLLKIRAIIEADLSNSDIGMTQLIRGLGMSRSQIYKKVKALTGQSPSIYIRSIRLHHAQKLLKTSDLNVSEIAYEVGFSSPVYFSDVFFETFGSRPNETRK